MLKKYYSSGKKPVFKIPELRQETTNTASLLNQDFHEEDFLKTVDSSLSLEGSA